MNISVIYWQKCCYPFLTLKTPFLTPISRKIDQILNLMSKMNSLTPKHISRGVTLAFGLKIACFTIFSKTSKSNMAAKTKTAVEKIPRRVDIKQVVKKL